MGRLGYLALYNLAYIFDDALMVTIAVATLNRQRLSEGGGRWLKNAIVQLGYSAEGKGIVFVAEQRDTATDNALYFSDRGMVVDDTVLDRLSWAPILPIRQ